MKTLSKLVWVLCPFAGLLTYVACTKQVSIKEQPVVLQEVQSQDLKSSIENLPPAAAIDTIGKWHNEYLEYIYSQIVLLNVNLHDTSTLKTFFYSKSTTFFNQKGITATSYPNLQRFPQYLTVTYTPSRYSSQGAALLSQLKALTDNYNPNNDAAFFTSLNSLKQSALNLSNINDVYAVGIPISVAINSYSYWKANEAKWETTLKNQSSNVSKTKCHVGLGQLGAADVGGAITGAIDGVVLGPGGSLAGGVLGAATGSLGNVAGQVMGCFFNWW